MKVVINKCWGGFGLSQVAYEKLIEYGVPVRAYIEQERDPETRLYKPEPRNEGEVIFDRDLPSERPSDLDTPERRRLFGRYWETWLSEKRTHPLLIRVVEELGEAANGDHAKLKVVEIPDDIEWEIDEYDGRESIAEKHRAWH